MPNVTDDGWSGFHLYVIYLTQGIVIGGSNLCIVAAILRYKALRSTKEYLIVMGLALADSLYQAAFVFAGIHRMKVVITGEYVTKLYTAWECMMTPQNLLWSWTPTLNNLMLSAVSLDRLLLVAAPTRYLNWTTLYAKIVLGVVYGYSMITGAILFVMTWHTRHTEPTLKAICVTEDAISTEITGPVLAFYVSWAPIAFAAMSVLLYAVLWAIYRKKKNLQIATTDQNEVKEQQLSRQRRFTVTLSISCACTFFVYCIPYGIGQTLWRIGGHNTLAMSFWLLSNLNPFCNVFIYPMRHKEMRKALLGLFTCKSMPPLLSLWDIKATRKRTKGGKTPATDQK